MRIAIHLTRREAVEDKLTGSHGYRWLPDGVLSGEIVLEIDEDKLAKLMGPRALRSKHHTSILADGAIKARAIHLHRMIEDAPVAHLDVPGTIPTPEETP